uniref:RNase H type-1 domain-containing protein n=1 Tax=viral metagenome TaxID=1070528 RepID=A0A6C0LVD0_9ZZZZ
MSIKLYFDGGSRGNPGIGGAGAVLYSNSDIEIASVSVKIHEKSTNNQAEYIGLISGLELAYEHGYGDVDVYGDSMLVVKQVSGEWKCKNQTLRILKDETVSIIKKHFSHVKLHHIYRSQNKRADELANIAMDSEV